MGDHNFIQSITGPVQQVVMSAVIGHNPAEKIALFIEHPERTFAAWVMVDVNEQLCRFVIGYNFTNIYGLEVMT